MGKWERKFGKYALHNLSLYLIICYGAGYLLSFINNDFLSYLTLNPYLILQGQVWRIFSWILIPPPSSNIFFVLITLYFYYSIGTTLERTWGAFYYNVYVFSGMLFTVVGSFLMMGYIYLVAPGGEVAWAGNACFTWADINSISLNMYSFEFFSTYYINMSLFLAFAATYPEMQVLLMLIIPIKVKWMGILYAILIVYDVISVGRQSLTLGLSMGFVVAASLLNFIIFFLMTRRRLVRSPKQMYRQHMYKKEVKTAEKVNKITRHKCAICGRTEEEYPDLEFRFCSKCDGNYEYCTDHLFTHQHIRRDN